jgi:ABC-2 type transport system ATP-binding protein
MSNNGPAVSLRGVTKKIGGKTLIHDLSFDVPKGEVFGFLGPNGAGKTTTIRMMVGLMSMTSGEITIGGHSIRSNFEQAIRHVGAIVENPEMYKYLSGYHNLVHYSRMIPGITHHRIDEVVKLVKLENRIHDKVRKYSLGMRQRLGVAQALLHKPSLLILDEPTNGLDPAGIRELRDYLRYLTKEEGITVIVSSHLLTEMELMCDRVAIIQQGKLIDVRPIQAFTGQSNHNQIYRIEVDAPEQALNILQDFEGIDDLQIIDGHVQLSAQRDHIPGLTARLVHANLKLYSIRVHQRSLEDQFLEITGSEQIG